MNECDSTNITFDRENGKIIFAQNKLFISPSWAIVTQVEHTKYQNIQWYRHGDYSGAVKLKYSIKIILLCFIYYLKILVVSK